LHSHETIIKLISATKTKKGLRVEARLDERDYETGKEISNDDMARLKLSYMNYILYGITLLKPCTHLTRSRIIG